MMVITSSLISLFVLYLFWLVISIIAVPLVNLAFGNYLLEGFWFSHNFSFFICLMIIGIMILISP